MTDLDVKQQHKFWNTQPVLQKEEKLKEVGVIDPNTDVEKVRKDPYPLPEGFEWVQVDTQNEEQRTELYDFLCKHYVIHPQNTFRFAYSAEFLNWALHPPGWKPEWHIGVRRKTENGSLLVAFISATPLTLLAYEKSLPMVAVDFLAVHQGLRGKFMAPLLIKEITRRVNLKGTFQAVFTCGKELTQPYTSSQYFHRLINYEKLVAIKFTSLKPGFDIKKVARMHSVNPLFANIAGFREMEEKDIPSVTKQLNEYNKKFPISQQFTEEEVSAMRNAWDGRNLFVGYLLLMIYSSMMPSELLVCKIDYDGREICKKRRPTYPPQSGRRRAASGAAGRPRRSGAASCAGRGRGGAAEWAVRA